MVTLNTSAKPTSLRFTPFEWSLFADFDENITIVDIDDLEENARRQLDPESRGIIAGNHADALHEFLKETSHF